MLDFTPDKKFSPMFESGKLSHAYIISGPAGAGKRALAETMAAAAVCEGDGLRPCGTCRHCRKAMSGIHPDIAVIEKAADKREIQVDQMRLVRSDAAVMPNEAEKKVYIILDAGKMNANAQNAMLKLLEEPPAHAVFLLCAENPSEMLPTVRSRCIEIALSAPSVKISSNAHDRAEALFTALETGELELTRYAFTLDKLQRQEFAELIDAARVICLDRMKDAICGKKSKLSIQKLNQASEVLAKAADYLEFSVGVGHIAGYLCAELSRNEE